MNPETSQIELSEQIKVRFKELPKVVQGAITSADVQKQLRTLADTNKLHLDQWQLLENDVMLTLLGFQPINELAEHLKADLDITSEQAAILATGISKIVFEPIREELERTLDNPDAKPAAMSGVEAVGAQALAAEKAQTVAPATPPPPPPEQKAMRAPISESYHAGEASTARKSVHDDPYREPPA